MAIGLLERDGLAILGGAVVGLIGMAITGSVLYAIYFFGMDEGVSKVKDFIKGLF